MSQHLGSTVLFGVTRLLDIAPEDLFEKITRIRVALTEFVERLERQKFPQQ